MGAGFEGLQGLNDEEWGPESRLHSRVDKSRDPITNHLSATWRPIIGQPRHAHAWDATRAWVGEYTKWGIYSFENRESQTLHIQSKDVLLN